MSTRFKNAWLYACAVLPAATALAAETATPQPQIIPYRAAGAQADAQFSNDQSKMTVEHRADGSTIIYMNGEAMQAVTATRRADGVIHYQCDDERLERALQQSTEHRDEK